MFKLINLQYLISYLGSLPFIIILFDNLFLYQFDPYITQDFIIYYSIIILVFIGSTNWDLKKNIPNILIFYGFSPSLFAIFIILLKLYLYEVYLFLIIIFLTQLFLDNFLYNRDSERRVYF